ncbi:MAG: nicotinate phosphoribosyltransferase [Methanomassiliicoccales archaeon]
MMRPIIQSMTDDDLYKFTMQQVVFHQYPDVRAQFEFVCRNKDIKLGFLAKQITEEIENLGDLRLTDEEAQQFLSMGFFRKDYVDFLRRFRYNQNLASFFERNDGTLGGIIEGTWLETILFEVKVLSIINELYFRAKYPFDNLMEENGYERLRQKVQLLKPYPRFMLTDFGTRRRYSSEWHQSVVEYLSKNCLNCIGSSNVYLARKFNLKAMGTMAHEFISAHLSISANIRESQKRALFSWLQEYDNNLGIALSDTFTSRAFFEDFGVTLSNGFTGVRHDSGDPIDFGWKVISHYKKMGIDPRTKMIVFSDGLNFPRAIEIFNTFAGLIGVSFGIGTNLSNDLGPEPINIVIKMVKCDNRYVVKLSDNLTKAIGDSAMIRKVKDVFGIGE